MMSIFDAFFDVLQFIPYLDLFYILLASAIAASGAVMIVKFIKGR